FYQLLWPLRYIVAALLLMSPGFVSTALALVLMLPIKGGPAAVRPNQMGQNYRSSGYGADGDIIDGEFETVRPQEGREETRLLEQHDYKPPQ
ncbi:MAG: FxsA family protein, partial [Eikenella corrodens]|nr:FxsA family protein [Eikenella corrodens]